MCDQTYTKVLLVVLAILDLFSSALNNLSYFVLCDQPKGLCNLIAFCFLVVDIACLVCVYVEISNRNPRLYRPYYIYLIVRAAILGIAFFASLFSTTSSSYAYETRGKQYSYNIQQSHAGVFFVSFWWCILLIVLIHVAVPDATRCTQRPVDNQQPVAQV